MVSILVPKRADSDTFPAHPTGRHILAGRLLGWVDGNEVGTICSHLMSFVFEPWVLILGSRRVDGEWEWKGKEESERREG